MSVSLVWKGDITGNMRTLASELCEGHHGMECGARETAKM
jgi:hypothetical protein